MMNDLTNVSAAVTIVISVMGGVSSLIVVAFWVRGEFERLVNIMKINYLFGCRRERKLENMKKGLQNLKDEAGVEGDILEEKKPEHIKFEDLNDLKDMEKSNFNPKSFFG